MKRELPYEVFMKHIEKIHINSLFTKHESHVGGGAD